MKLYPSTNYIDGNIDGNKSDHKCIKYALTGTIFIVCAMFLIQSVAVIIDYEKTENYTNNTCQGLTDLKIVYWNLINDRAITTTKSLNTGQNITLFWPPINVYIFWRISDANTWYARLNDTSSAANTTTPPTFPCYIDTPQTIGITQHLSDISGYYITAASMFIIISVILIYASIQRKNLIYRNKYYTYTRLN